MNDGDLKKAVLGLVRGLNDGDAPTIRSALAAIEEMKASSCDDDELLGSLLTLGNEQLQVANFVNELGNGHLSVEAPPGIARLGHFKQLQANLRHVNWLMERIAEGDYHQKLDFLGDFESSMDRMVAALRTQEELEERLKQSESLYRSVVEESPTNITISDMDGNIIFINPAGVRMFGFDSEDEVIGQNLIDNLTPESRMKAIENISLRIDAAGLDQVEYEGVKKSGESFWMEVHGSLLTDAEGHPNRLLLMSRDINDRKVLERELANSELRYRTMVESTSSMVYILDKDLNILYGNRQAMLAMGASIIGSSFSNFLDDKSRMDMLDALLRSGQGVVMSQETLVIAHDGQRLWVQLTAQSIPHEDGTAIFVSCNDITNLKRSEDKLRSATRKLTLLGSLTRHDVINYLTSLEGHLELAQVRNKEESVDRHIQKARQSAHNIMHQMELTRSYQNLGTMEPEWVDIRAGVEREVASMETGNVQVLSDLPQLEILSDPIILSCIKNLIENSLKHGQKTTMVRFAFQEIGAYGVLIMEDDGKGIPASLKEQIFEWGYKGRSGHGLHFIREALSSSGMWIRENGVEGKGARFEIIIPREYYRTE